MRPNLLIRVSFAMALTVGVLPLAACGGPSASQEIGKLFSIPSELQNCVTTKVVFSKEKRWASAQQEPSCDRIRAACAASGAACPLSRVESFVRESEGRWKVVEGDQFVPPSCSLHVPRDLIPE